MGKNNLMIQPGLNARAIIRSSDLEPTRMEINLFYKGICHNKLLLYVELFYYNLSDKCIDK